MHNDPSTPAIVNSPKVKRRIRITSNLKNIFAMEENIKPVAQTRYAIIVVNNRKHSSLMGKRERVTFTDRAQAFAYIPCVLEHVECDGAYIVAETYWA